jgi:geranylgeranyl reductase family protein
MGPVAARDDGPPRDRLDVPVDATVDVLVVGAGPAGIAAGITATARGLDALVVDRAAFPRDKTCGDGLTTAALRALERLGVPSAALTGAESVVRETVLVSPSGRRVHLPLPGDGKHAVVAARRDLDAALVAHARATGVEVRERTGLVALEHDADGRGVVAELAGGRRVRARSVVAADGHYSPTRRLVQPSGAARLGEWSAFRQYFCDVDDPRMWVLFEPDLLPGYAWVFPLPGGRANVGFGMLRAPGVDGRRVGAVWHSLLRRPSLRRVLGARARPEAPHRAWPIPTAYDPARLACGRVLFAGDAASAVDPLTGEGVAQALETGALAADAIAGAERGRDVAAVARRYRAAVDRRLGRDLRFAARLQHVLARPWGARGAIRAAGLTPWTRRQFARWMFEDYPRAAVLTPDRWRQGLFSASGAYADGPSPA